MIAQGEVFLRALGARAEALHPELRAQMGAEGAEARAEGVFAVAGSRFGRLTALARPFVGRRMLVTRHGRDVPFTLRTRSATDALGRATLDSERAFRFSSGTQFISDRLTVSVHAGLVRNLLGARGRVEMIEECSVTDEGFLRMRTRRIALRIGTRRIALRGILGIHVDLVDGWDAENSRRTIDMRAVNPLVGTVLEYRGWYRHVALESDVSAGEPDSQKE